MRFLKPSDICRLAYKDPDSEARCIRGWVIHFISEHQQRHDFYHDLHERLYKLAHLFSFEFRSDSHLATINDKCLTDQDIQLLCDGFNASVSFFRKEFQ